MVTFQQSTRSLINKLSLDNVHVSLYRHVETLYRCHGAGGFWPVNTCCYQAENPFRLYEEWSGVRRIH